MNISSPVRTGVRNGMLTALYIGLVVTVMQITSHYAGPDVPYLTGFIVLTLFVVSALITGSLVLWMPVRLMLEGSRHEAGVMLVSTGVTLVALLAVVAGITLAVR